MNLNVYSLSTTRTLIIAMLMYANPAIAGRSGMTTITQLIVKTTWIEIYTDAAGSCGTNPNRWHLRNTHPNYDQLYSGLLASKTTGKKVDLVGDNNCGVAEDVNWAYVVVD